MSSNLICICDSLDVFVNGRSCFSGQCRSIPKNDNLAQMSLLQNGSFKFHGLKELTRLIPLCGLASFFGLTAASFKIQPNQFRMQEENLNWDNRGIFICLQIWSVSLWKPFLHFLTHRLHFTVVFAEF